MRIFWLGEFDQNTETQALFARDDGLHEEPDAQEDSEHWILKTSVPLGQAGDSLSEECAQKLINRYC